MDFLTSDSDKNQVLEFLRSLENRISRIESHLGLISESEEKSQSEKTNPIVSAENLEFHIGQFWFAKVGIVLLAVGIAFLLTFPYQNLPSILPSLFGYVLTIAIFTVAHFWRNSFNLISRYLVGAGLILIYFTTLRLHFFSPSPTVINPHVELILLSLVVIFNLIVSAKRSSIYLTSLSLTMGYITAIVSNQTYLLFSILLLMSLLTVYFKLKFQWQKLIIYGIVLTFLTHFVWFLNNPFLGNKLEFVSSPQNNLFFILIYILIFAAGNYFRSRDLPENNIVIISTFLNSFSGYGLYLLLSISKFNEHLGLFHLIASILFLGLSVAFWVKEKSKYSTFFYAMFGYAALSVAIIAQFKLPNFFIWLSWQSIIVISTAIWFRSKFIIVANFLIFAMLFFVYLIMAGRISTISLSFGFVALLSARILNWQKDQLELKTEMMRNAYLVSAFFVFPYALYHIVPEGYIALSWIGVTLFYFLMSVVLNNKKYRWMAILTLLLTVTYILIIGIVKLDPALRIASFLVLGIALMAISVIYTRLRAKSGSEETANENTKIQE
jgi:hypothetical protein